eukprot:tig00021494_g21932.t1
MQNAGAAPAPEGAAKVPGRELEGEIARLEELVEALRCKLKTEQDKQGEMGQRLAEQHRELTELRRENADGKSKSNAPPAPHELKEEEADDETSLTQKAAAAGPAQRVARESREQLRKERERSGKLSDELKTMDEERPAPAENVSLKAKLKVKHDKEMKELLSKLNTSEATSERWRRMHSEAVRKIQDLTAELEALRKTPEGAAAAEVEGLRRKAAEADELKLKLAQKESEIIPLRRFVRGHGHGLQIFKIIYTCSSRRRLRNWRKELMAIKSASGAQAELNWMRANAAQPPQPPLPPQAQLQAPVRSWSRSFAER